jgi:hypothetical protein
MSERLKGYERGERFIRSFCQLLRLCGVGGRCVQYENGALMEC